MNKVWFLLGLVVCLDILECSESPSLLTLKLTQLELEKEKIHCQQKILNLKTFHELEVSALRRNLNSLKVANSNLRQLVSHQKSKSFA